MAGYLSLVLHAHLPFVRHPDHEKFLEENWLFEAMTESYIPLIQVMDNWLRDGMKTRLTLTLTPPLCSMLLDPLLQDRYVRHLNCLIELAEEETHRTQWEAASRRLSEMYYRRFTGIRDTYFGCNRDLVGAFRKFQDLGRLEIMPCAATQPLLPLLATHPPSIRAQIRVASPHEGYPAHSRYRHFYRDIGFDLDFDYVRPYLPSPDHRGFTGIKYHRITGGAGAKEAYDRHTALRAADEHAGHFLVARLE